MYSAASFYCDYPFGPGETTLIRVVRCAGCGVKYHEPCFWRVLPLEERAEYIQSTSETNEEDEEEDDDGEGFEIVCAACRTRKG